jgi:DNA-binding MarR family transcriptional regulator
MSREQELLAEIRDLLQVIAEPALAKRDARLRASLRSVVGGSAKRAKAVLLMDGTRTQSAIAKDAGMDQANVSRLVKVLAAEQLISSDARHPQLLLKVPGTFFDGESTDE